MSENTWWGQSSLSFAILWSNHRG